MLSHIKVFLQPGQAETNESQQGIAAHSHRCWERTPCPGNAVLCCPVVHCACYCHGTSSYRKNQTKTKNHTDDFCLAFSSECEKDGKNKPKHLCYNLCHLKLQWISVYFPPKGLALTILFLKIPLLQSLGSSLTQCTHTKHRSLAHSSCKIKEVQSHTSTIKNINTTGFKRISRQLKSFWDLFYRQKDFYSVL